jgi:predicted phosphodiesterase
MRIALLSDIHGNSVALDAVLDDIRGQDGVDGFCILGDLVALGPDPVGVLERLTALPNPRFVRGNTDRYVASGDRPAPTLEEAAAKPELIASLVEVANTFAWTQGMVTSAGWLPWLRDLPLELSLTLPDGTRFLGVHASPGKDDGPGVTPETTASELAPLFSGCEATLVCVGHTHLPSDRVWNGIRIVNLGSVSLSLAAGKVSSYVLVDATEAQIRIEHRRVSYDRSAVIDQLNQIAHPGRAYLIKYFSNSNAG